MVTLAGMSRICSSRLNAERISISSSSAKRRSSRFAPPVAAEGAGAAARRLRASRGRNPVTGPHGAKIQGRASARPGQGCGRPQAERRSGMDRAADKTSGWLGSDDRQGFDQSDERRGSISHGRGALGRARSDRDRLCSCHTEARHRFSEAAHARRGSAGCHAPEIGQEFAAASPLP